MSISQKIKTTNNQIKQNKAQHDLHRQTAKIWALSSGNVNKYEFLRCFTRKKFGRKTCYNEKIWISLIS